MKQIVIFNQSSGYLTTEIANAFVRSGKYEKVVLAAGNEISPLLKLDELVYVEKMPAYVKKSTLTRAMSWLKGAVWVVRKARRKYRNYELFLISNPPTVAFSSLFIKNKYSTLIYDVYPDGLGDGVFVKKSGVVYRIWSKCNKRYFGRAEYVYTITEGMRRLISKYCPLEHIEVVDLWSNPNLPVLNIPKEENKFVIDNGLVGKFIIMYSGNMGMGHDLDVLVDVADKLKAYEDIVFLFVGDGYLKPIIENKANDYGLKNVIILPYQDRAILPYSLSCSDLAVVSTAKAGGGICIPSKTFDLIKLGRPILCVAEKDSCISQLVCSRQVGESFTKNQVEDIVGFIIDMYTNPEKLEKYSINSFEASKDYTSKLAQKFVK